MRSQISAQFKTPPHPPPPLANGPRPRLRRLASLPPSQPPNPPISPSPRISSFAFHLSAFFRHSHLVIRYLSQDTFAPTALSALGEITITCDRSSFDAASSIPWLTSPRMVRGARFATTTICRPTRSAAW